MCRHDLDAGPPDTRQRLLEAASALFAERGFAATSTREIARRAGCNLALIRHYFGSKEGLLRATVDEEMGEMAGLLAKGGEAPPAERVAQVVSALVDRFDRTRHTGLPIVVQELLLPGSRLGRKLRPRVRGVVEELIRLLEACRRDGALGDVDPALAALVLVGMAQSYFLVPGLLDDRIGPHSPELMARLKRTVTQVFTGGALGGARRQAGGGKR